MPDGTSRLLQVRLTVQFQSVLETFVPHDTVLSFATPTELTESALTSACMLHPSPMPLTSSASSLRRQPLGEISEDAEESPHIRGQSKSKVVATPTATFTTEFTKDEWKEPSFMATTKPTVEKAQQLPQVPQEVTAPRLEKDSVAFQNSSNSTPRASSITPTPTVAPAANKSLPSTPERTPPNTSDGKTSGLPIPDETPELPPIQHLSNHYRVEETDPRTSLQSARPSVISVGLPSVSNYDSYDIYKPKVKRGPRPHVEPETRPLTAGSVKKGSSQRLVANLPTSVRTQNRSAQTNTDRPRSQQSSRSVPSKFVHRSESTILPPLPSPNHISSLFLPHSQQVRAYSRAGSITSTATAAATPEKLRLMKALQLRKRNQQQAKRISEKPGQSEEQNTSLRSQIQADLNSIRSQTATTNSGAERTSASRIAEAVKATEAARMASPTSITNISEVPSTQSSSFVEDIDGATSHASISSDTSSSVTPKADSREAQQRKQTESPVPVPVPVRIAGDESDLPIHTTTKSLEKQPFAPGEEKTKPPASVESTSLFGLDEAMPSYQQSVPTREQSGPQKEQKEQPVPAVTTQPHVATENVPEIAIREVVSSQVEEERRSTVSGKLNDGREHRRRGADLEPIKVLSSPELSEAEVSDDDSFMEELQRAKLQHAKPVAVGRSPVTPIYHNLGHSTDHLRDISRTVSSPLNDTANSRSTTPDQAKPRSIRNSSTALPSWPPSSENIPPVPLARKGPLSSGISKRIKALEVFTSGRESSASPPPSSSNTTLMQKSKAALGSTRNRQSFVQGGNAPNTSTTTAPPALLPIPAQTPEIEPTDYEQSIPLHQPQSSATGSYQPLQKGETISVTARIVRSPDTTSTINEDSVYSANDSQPVLLQRSTLTVQHEQPDFREHKPIIPREASIVSIENSAKSSDLYTYLPTSESMASRLSVASSKKRDKANFPRSSSDNSSFTEEKSKQSRARRLMQRVSNLSTNSRRNIAGAFSASSSSKEQLASNTITEHAESDHDLASVAESVSHVVDIGDVNVQFPDTLLWKRRFLRIDDKGYLIFTPPTMESNTRNISRRFHLSEFKKPTLPDVEREEMAWSILLDLEDGSCIQCACESKYTQSQVLRSKPQHLSRTNVTDEVSSAGRRA